MAAAHQRRRHWGWPLDASDRPPIREIDPDGEIIAVDVERDVDILGVQIWTAGIVKALRLAAGQDNPPDRVCITLPAFEPVAQVNRAQLVLVGSLDAIAAHGNKGDLLR